MDKMILGVFEDRTSAEEAINELREFGIPGKEISIMMKDGERATEFNDTGSNVIGGAATGATTGGVLGGLAGLLIGVGAITLPGIGAILIGGPIATALGLTGAAATTVSGAVTGALAGGLVGSLVGWGVPEDEARVYEDRIKEGAILIAVPANDYSEDETRNILEKHNADQIRSISNPEEPARPNQDLDEGTYRPAYFEEVRKRSK